MPAEDPVAQGLDALRYSHEERINNLLPPGYYASDDEEEEEDDFSTSSLPLGASALQTPPASLAMSSSSTSQAATAPSPATMGVRPRFNVDSAAALLARFRTEMVRHFPAVVLGGGEEGNDVSTDVSVADMAARRPFVLLAVLAAASGNRTLQGYSLYDEEFRKILGLKFVAGGERSLELLQGLLIYCAW